MSIQKKSLLSTLKTAKKANIASAPLAEIGEVNGTTGVKRSAHIRTRNLTSLIWKKKRCFASRLRN